MWLQQRSRRLTHAVQRAVAPRTAIVLLASAVVALGGCTTTGSGLKGVAVHPLSAEHYPSSQTVDVLAAQPTLPHAAIAELALSDPTGTATVTQLTAQLVDAARRLGADALVVEKVSRPAAAGVGFNPAGGQMQGSSAGGTLSVNAQAIRYTH
jgi:hypothetical protein